MSESSESENEEEVEFEKKDVEFDGGNKHRGLITRGRMSLAIIAVFFMFLVVAGEFLQFTDLLGVNGITRGDVPKYRLHVLSTPMLEKVLIKPTTINVTAGMDQLGTSDVFHAQDDNHHHAFFRMNQNYDFEGVEPLSTGNFAISPDAPPCYSFDFEKTKTIINRNDKYFTELIFAKGGWDPELTAFNIINYGRSAVIYFKKSSTDSCIYIDRLGNPTATVVPDLVGVLEAAADPYGKQFFALVAPPKNTKGELSLVGVNFDKMGPKGPLQVKFDIKITEAKTKLYHSGLSRSITLIDDNTLRIFDASDGKKRAEYQLVDKEEAPSNKGDDSVDKNRNQDKNNDDAAPSTIPAFTIIPGVPAAIFGNKLIDLRSGEVVDTLDGYGKNSVFAVDFANKKLYYSTCEPEGDQKPTMNVAIYDLHEIKLDFQVTLAGRIIVADEAIERDDGIKSLFIREGKLIALSGPR